MRLFNTFFMRACAFYFNSDSAHALCAPVYALGGAHLVQISHCKVLDVGKIIFLLKNDDMHALNTAPLRPLNL
jgi:hypothetical protein